MQTAFFTKLTLGNLIFIWISGIIIVVISLNVINNDIKKMIYDLFDNRNKSFRFVFNSNSEADTLNFGFEFAKYFRVGDVITLNGELGTGKTVFVKGIGKFFNIKEDISSPTFTIVNEYNAKNINIYHFDVYRLSDVDDFVETIGTDYFGNGVSLIEWGNMIDEILPRNTIHIDFIKNKDDSRSITVWRK